MTSNLPAQQRQGSLVPPPNRTVGLLLESYTSQHPLRAQSPLPPSSRVNPQLPQRLPPRSPSNPFFWGWRTWLAFWEFVVRKAIQICLSLLSHFLFGPKRKSWGYRMTLIASAMRDVANHTSLADIILIRRLVSLHFIVPLPRAEFVPVTWPVPRQRGGDIARGFFEQYDRAETGDRLLTGEWVVSARTHLRWKHDRLDRQLMAAGREPYHAKRRQQQRARQAQRAAQRRAGARSTPRDFSADSSDEDIPSGLGDAGLASLEARAEMYRERARRQEAVPEKVIYYIHGGAYYVGNAATHRLITIGVSEQCRARVYAITYRLAPEHTFPLPLHDVLHGYLRLLRAPLNISPSNIIIAGDSAGGGLSLALCMYLRDEGYQLPAGLILMSPWVDLTMSCGSWDENGAVDVVPRPEADDHLNPVACYLGPQSIATWVTHPYASPLFGDFHGLCPMLIQSGDSEVLRDEITLLAHKASLAGVHVTHELYEDMVHVFQMFTFLPGTKSALESVGRWVRKTLPKIEEEQRRAAGEPESSAPPALPGGVEAEIAEGARRAEAAGERVGQGGFGRVGVEITQDEINAIADRGRQRARRTTNPQSSLLFDIAPPTTDQPTVDVDSLPRSRSPSRSSGQSRSGSPTPIASPVSSYQSETSFNSRTHAPPLRRALTAIAGPTRISTASTPTSPTSTPEPAVRQRRRTQGQASFHGSPALNGLYRTTSSSTSAFGSSTSLGSEAGPVSPPPSIRVRLRSPSGTAATSPRMRFRSESNADLHHLVQDYSSGGAANETTVYAPGGQVRAVCHLIDPEESGEGADGEDGEVDV